MVIELIDHTADVALRIHAPSLKELVEDCINSVKYLCKCGVEQTCIFSTIYKMEGNTEDLLFNILNDVIYYLDVDEVLPMLTEIKEDEVKVDFGRIKGKPALELKALTYHRLEIKKRDDAFETLLVFDV
ncbi:MAG: archease [Thermotogae bacterium]|nr:archease [Thermotogota bacterium]